MWGCAEDREYAPPTQVPSTVLGTPVTGPTSVVSDVLDSWPTPTQIVQMAPPTFIYYGTQLFYYGLEVAPGVFRRVEFTFRGSSPTDVYTLHRFRIYVEHARTEPVVLYDPPLTLIDGLGAGMLMSDAQTLLGEADEISQSTTDAHWTYRFPGMTCQVDMVPDVSGVWRVFNLEFVFE